MDPVKVGQSIALLRKKYGMTQLDLAERLSVTDKAVSRWERGLGTPDTSLLVKLSLILDIDIETLLEGNVTVDDLGWRGMLLLSYPEEILPTDLVFSKRIIYLQLCYFLLAGIKDIVITGSEDMVELTRRYLNNNIRGVGIEYETCDQGNIIIYNSKKAVDYNKNDGLMVISGFDLFYGKDFTKCLRRVMNNSHSATRICTFEGKATSFCFYPRGTVVRGDEDKYYLERGVFYLPVRTRNDLLDAGCFFQILEGHQEEAFMDIRQIMERRHIEVNEA